MAAYMTSFVQTASSPDCIGTYRQCPMHNNNNNNPQNWKEIDVNVPAAPSRAPWTDLPTW